MTIVFHARPFGRFIEIKSNLRWKNFIERIKTPIFLGDSFSSGDNVKPQSNLEEKDKPSILKDIFLQEKTHPFSHQQIPVITLFQQNTLSFSALKSTSYFLPHSAVSCRSYSSSEANSNCYHRSEAKIQSSIISIYSNITNNIIRKVINM